MSAEEFLKKLENGGAIVSTCDLSPIDIAVAIDENRVYYDDENNGYAFVPIEE